MCRTEAEAMTSILSAVNTDTYGGLTGYKRPLQSAPNRVPGNLPASNKVDFTPGGEIRAPAIRSSAAKPDRKTNQVVPYSRVVPIDKLHNMGRASPGDVIFVRRGGRAAPGHALFRRDELAGMDKVNRFLHEQYWHSKSYNDAYRNILPASATVATPIGNWRTVPALQEWVLDGVVLSNDEPGQFHGGSAARDGQLFNIAVQGVCMINNGFQDGKGRGVLNNAPPAFDKVAEASGPLYHQLPLQMFDRQVLEMDELFVGLVAESMKGSRPSLLPTALKARGYALLA